MELNILVDFDNIAQRDRSRGLVYISEKILDRLGCDELLPYKRVKIRFYGGWYEQNNVTNRAQLLQSEIQSNFPRRINIIDNQQGLFHSVIGYAELSYSLVIDPQHHLFSTYRSRGMPSGLYCEHPSSLGCSNINCPLIYIHDFINNGRCTNQCCNIKPKDMIHRGEQKLVDTMVISDLLYLASQKTSLLCIVSSDDDFWPGIETAVLMGSKVIHVHTKNRATPIEYCQNIGSNYLQNIL